MADTKRKVEEILGLTQSRRERKKPLEDLGIMEEAHDPYIKALYEQPPVATDQDVIVQPGTPGVDEPMATPPADEAPPEVPDDLKEPEDEDEELRRALFNTLSELIDLGRVERDEVSIRKYAEEHQDELGELAEVLDEVVDMLVVSADIYRETQTFEPESTPGQKDRGEQLKPGVGGQVPVGSTVSTVIASDQTEPKGQPIMDAVDAILAGQDVNEVLGEQAGDGDPEVFGEMVRAAVEWLRPFAGREPEAHVADVSRQVQRQFGISQEEADEITSSALERVEQLGESVTEQMDIARAAVAVELRFGKKEEAGAAKGALLQYKGIDGVEEIADGGLVVFTTDSDVDEARNRVETIMRNARIPLESVQIEYYEPLWEARVGHGSEPVSTVHVTPLSDEEGSRVIEVLHAEGYWAEWADGDIAVRVETQSPLQAHREVLEVLKAAGIEVSLGEQISTSHRVPYVREVPMPLARGQSGADMEAEGGVPHFWAGFKLRVYDQDRIEEVRQKLQAIDLEVEVEQLGSSDVVTINLDDVDEENRSRIRRVASEMGSVQKLGEQAEPELDTDREPGEEKYLKPFYGPDDEEMPPEEEPSPESTIWRMDIPEDPDEFDRLAEVLNAAKEQGLIMSWTRVTGEEDEIPPEEFEEPEGEVLDLRDADIVPTIEQIEPPVGELEPDEVPVEEPIEPEEKEYIAVEFAPETEVEERERFPDFIAAETGDPDTGEGGILVGGWEPAGDEEETPEDDELLTPGEEPVEPEAERKLLGVGEAAKLTDLSARGYWFEVACDTNEEAGRLLEVAKRTKVVEGPDRHRRAVVGVVNVDNEERAADIVCKMAAQADLELTEAAITEQGNAYQRYLQQQKTAQHALKHAAKAEPRVSFAKAWKAGEKKPSAPELPPDVQQLVKDYRAAMMSGDTDLAQRIKGELEFELEMLGIDVKTVLGESVTEQGVISAVIRDGRSDREIIISAGVRGTKTVDTQRVDPVGHLLTVLSSKVGQLARLRQTTTNVIEVTVKSAADKGRVVDVIQEALQAEGVRVDDQTTRPGAVKRGVRAVGRAAKGLAKRAVPGYLVASVSEQMDPGVAKQWEAKIRAATDPKAESELIRTMVSQLNLGTMAAGNVVDRVQKGESFEKAYQGEVAGTLQSDGS